MKILEFKMSPSYVVLTKKNIDNVSLKMLESFFMWLLKKRTT